MVKWKGNLIKRGHDARKLFQHPCGMPGNSIDDPSFLLGRGQSFLALYPDRWTIPLLFSVHGFSHQGNTGRLEKSHCQSSYGHA